MWLCWNWWYLHCVNLSLVTTQTAWPNHQLPTQTNNNFILHTFLCKCHTFLTFILTIYWKHALYNQARTLGNLTETVISLGLRTALVLIHFFTSFRLFASLRANKLVTLNLWRVWTRQETRKKCNLGSLDPIKSRYSPFKPSNTQCSGTVRSTEHRIQGGVKFGQLQGSSSRNIWSADPDIIFWADTIIWANIVNWADNWTIVNRVRQSKVLHNWLEVDSEQPTLQILAEVFKCCEVDLIGALLGISVLWGLGYFSS